MLEARNRLGDSFSLLNVHQSDSRGSQGALQEAVIQLKWKHSYIDVACDQCIDCLGVIEVQQTDGIIHCAGSLQNLQHERSQGGSRHTDGQALTTELRELRNGLGVPVKNEYCRIGYSPERIQDVRIARLRQAERGEGCLDPRHGTA